MNLLITSCVTPVLLNPPSWKRFCMVTKRVKSLKSARQKRAQSTAGALPSGLISCAKPKKPSKPLMPVPAVVSVGLWLTVFTRMPLALPRR